MSGIDFDFSSLQKGLEEMSRKQLAPTLKLDSEAKKIEGYAKQHAPWTDRTGRARQSITAKTSTIPKGYRITLAIGVDYGIWLEFAHEKNFAIILPTLERKAPDVMKSFVNFMERLK